MPQHHRLGPGDALAFDHRAPIRADGLTFVFFNPLSGDSATWEGKIAPALRAVGHGTLLWSYRGQTESPLGPDVEVSAEQIAGDALDLLRAEAPAGAGGLCRALDRRAVRGAGAPAGRHGARPRADQHPAQAGPAPRLAERRLRPRRRGRRAGAAARPVFAAAHGPSLAQGQPRGLVRRDAAYTPLPPGDGACRLLASSATADWDLACEDLRLPVVVLTGLQDHVFCEPADVGELARRLPDARQVDVPKAGHLLPMERPEAVVDACLDLAGRV